MLEPPSISGTAAFSETTFVIKTPNQAQGIPGAGAYEYSGTYTLKGGTITQTVTACGATQTIEDMSGGDRHLPYTAPALTVLFTGDLMVWAGDLGQGEYRAGTVWQRSE